jgi:Protein of unknown function (DUF3306)
MSNDTPEGSFLSRWSRQKRAGKRMLPAAETPVIDEAPAVDPASLPKIDDLTAESDISVFLRKGVPEALQKLALRRMWSLDPEIRDFVEMAENQFDFHAPGGIPGLFQELAEGSDVSVWLAQATQSVVRKDPKEEIAVAELGAPVENGHELAAAQQDAVPRVDVDQAGEPSAARAIDIDADAPPTLQQAEVAGGLDTGLGGRARLSTAPSRRRHGGALPT